MSEPAKLRASEGSDGADGLPEAGPAIREAYGRALAFVRPIYGERLLGTNEPVLSHAIGTANNLVLLKLDEASVVSGLLFAVPDYLTDYKDRIESAFGTDVAGIVGNIARLHQLRLVTRTAAMRADAAAKAQQFEVLRKMLLAMVEDIRAVLVRLASRTQTMHALGGALPAVQWTIARETLDIYAPLANRLGVWQLKSVLEDAAFQILDPRAFDGVTALIDERQSERDAFINECVARLRSELSEAGIEAIITGRPKHIYSIWNKMRRKGREFAELFDLRAVRIIVNELRDCYTVLGVAHNLWQPIPKEFDDYISRPKPNGYRSLHTAVIAPDGRPLEIQIRTHDMHREAEGGVAAHWRYKESGKSERGRLGKQAEYEQRIGWLRGILAWRDEVVDGADWVDQAKQAALDDSVYVLTPQGRVIDLPRGSTPIDFAYHVHTDLGHRCRGARVDGAMVPLDTKLDNGQTVEIVAAKQGGPSRDWLNAERGYLGSHRARTKVRQWFNAIEQHEMSVTGRAAVERELQRLGKTAANLELLAKGLGFDSAEALFIAVARDEVGPRQLQTALRGEADAPVAGPLPTLTHPSRADATKGEILIVGVDRILTQLAKCCRPVPPDPIQGFVTRGRGVSIHRRNCKSFSELTRAHAERCINAEWGSSAANHYAVDVFVEANDRQGLLRDVSDVFAHDRINVVAVSTQSRAGIASMQFTVEVSGLGLLSRALERIGEIRGVFTARRR
jgi:GTP pyrophosphokinase